MSKVQRLAQATSLDNAKMIPDRRLEQGRTLGDRGAGQRDARRATTRYDNDHRSKAGQARAANNQI